MILRQFIAAITPPIVVVAAAFVARMLARKANTHAPDHGRVRIQYGDFFLACDSSHHLPKILAYLPDFGRPLADIVVALNVHEPNVIDVGANIGDTALLLARFAPGAKVLCVEGNPHFIPDLKLNTSQITGVTIAQAILSDRSSETRGRFFSHRNHGGTSTLGLDQAGELLHTQTLDDLLREYPECATPHVIKVDTDGFDPAILRGAKEVLTAARPVAFYEWDPYSYTLSGENDFSHADFLMALGYDHFLIFTNEGQPLLRVRQPGHEVWESLGRFSLRRRSIDGWHYDIAAFPSERSDVFERLWRRYSV